MKLSRSQRRLIHFGFGTLLAVALHVLWLSMPGDPLFPERSSRSVSGGIRILPSTGEQRWKPVQFALPSAAGFSGVVMVGEDDGLNHLAGTVDLTALGQHRPRSVKMSPHGRKRSLAAPQLPVVSFGETEHLLKTEAKWRVWWRTGHGPAIIVFHEPDKVPQSVKAVDGVVDFDEYGMVAGLTLDALPELNGERRAVLKALYSMRIPRGNAENGVPFRLAFTSGEKS